MLIFDLQEHPSGGLIFDLQDYSAALGANLVTLTPQASTSVGRFLDTDLQTVVYPQAEISYTAHQDVSVSGSVATTLTPNGNMAYAPPIAEYLVNGAAQTSFTPGAAIAYSPASAAYTVNGDGAIVLTPAGAMAYATAGSNLVDGSVGVSFAPVASISYVASTGFARYVINAAIDIEEVLQ